MSSDFISHLAGIPCSTRHFAPKTTIVAMDDPVSALFVVKSGLVHLVRFQKDGGAVILQRAPPRAILAEASVFSETYHCAALAVTDTELWAYPVESVQKLLAQDTLAAKAYTLHLAGEVRFARRRAEILALKKVSERLEAWLTWNHGLLPDRGAWHHVADEIGISREALYRELSKRRKMKG